MLHSFNILKSSRYIFALVLILKINSMRTSFLACLLAANILFPSCGDVVEEDIFDFPDSNTTNKPNDDKDDEEEETLESFTVNYQIYPTMGHKPISKLIYGIGFYNNEAVAFKESPTFIRFGGNNTTPYNWEINCSNAGHDWYHNSYVYNFGNQKLDMTPAAVWTKLIDACRGSNKVPFITVPILWGVAADANGNVEGDNDTHRWKKLIPKKSSITTEDFTDTPDTSDDYVFIDEGINYLTKKYGKGTVKYSLDNEPDLWTFTHFRLMNACAGYKKDQKLECSVFLDRTIEAAKAIKDVDEEAELFGFVSYGFNGYLSFQGAPDWNDELKNKYGYKWFIDYYLDATKKASDEYGRRLVDVLDFHAYPSEKGDNRIIERDVKSTKKDIKVRLQAPRRFWDPEYAKVYDPEVNQWDEWIIKWNSQFLPILQPMQESIRKYNPGTKIAVTEFQIGGYEDISGTIALADILGIYGKYDVYAANHWGTPGRNGFLAYDIYRDYDGKGSTFGDTYVMAETTEFEEKDKYETSVYASVNNGDTKELHIVVLNKNMEKNLKGEFSINGSNVQYSQAEVYVVKGLSDEKKEEGWRESIQKDEETNIEIKGNKFTYTLPKLSVAHIVLR